MVSYPRILLPLLVLGLIAGTLSSQQFVQQPGALAPGPAVWSEGVETFDANGDGWLDIIYTNGMGFNSAQGALAPQLFINQGVPGMASFTDETSTRIPAGFTQQGKAIITCDVDGDGDEDIVFGNAFLTQPRILINDGTGIFADETTTRFPTITLGCFGVGCGDLDGDGDMDLVFSDTGSSQFGPGAPPKLFINDGTGVFTNSPAMMNGINKVGAMQVNIVDMDNDFDLDVIIDGKSSGQHLYINDGTANFTVTTNTLPSGGSSVYETDWCDLDNDGDIDGAYVSLSGFQEGLATNNSTPAGLSFSGSTSLISGTNGNDDNEVAFIDANNDGILDLLVCSLANIQEKLYINAGTMAPGSFVQAANAFSSTSDSSLDLTIGDYDNDGDLDVATAQGESGNFTNRLYLNNGPVDTTGPNVLRVEQKNALVGQSELIGGLPIHAHIQDSSYDNGKIFFDAVVSGSVSKDGNSVNFSFPMSHIGGGIFRGTLAGLPPFPGGSVESVVQYQIIATDRQGNQTASAMESFQICGWSNYGPNTGVNDMSLTLSNEPVGGQVTTVTLTGAPASTQGLLVADQNAANFPGLGGTVLVDVATPVVFDAFTNASGNFFLPAFLPPTIEFIGASLSLQAFMPDPSKPFGFAMSNGLRVLICGDVPESPSLLSVTPTVFGTGATVALVGTEFAPGMTVVVDGVTYAATVTSPTAATFVTTATAACDSSLMVVNPGPLPSNSLPVNGTPTILSTNPPTGTSAGNAIYVIAGSNFGPGTTVTIGGNPCLILSAGASTLVTRTPAGAVGPATVVVTNPAGCTVNTTYTYF